MRLLMKQYKELQHDPPEGIDVWLADDEDGNEDLMTWECSIQGPNETY